VEAAMIVPMCRQQLLLQDAAKMYEGRCSVITKFTCYYWAYALAIWQRVSFYQPIRGWFWNCPHKWATFNIVKTSHLIFVCRQSY
jgi:hypothetical protein